MIYQIDQQTVNALAEIIVNAIHPTLRFSEINGVLLKLKQLQRIEDEEGPSSEGSVDL